MQHTMVCFEINLNMAIKTIAKFLSIEISIKISVNHWLDHLRWPKPVIKPITWLFIDSIFLIATDKLVNSCAQSNLLMVHYLFLQSQVFLNHQAFTDTNWQVFTFTTEIAAFFFQFSILHLKTSVTDLNHQFSLFFTFPFIFWRFIPFLNFPFFFFTQVVFAIFSCVSKYMCKRENFPLWLVAHAYRSFQDEVLSYFLRWQNIYLNNIKTVKWSKSSYFPQFNFFLLICHPDNYHGSFSVFILSLLSFFVVFFCLVLVLFFH